MAFHPRLGQDSLLGTVLRELEQDVMRPITEKGALREIKVCNIDYSNILPMFTPLAGITRGTQTIWELGNVVLSLVDNMATHTTASQDQKIAKEEVQDGDEVAFLEALKGITNYEDTDLVGWALLHHAAHQNCVFATNILLHRGADLNSRTRDLGTWQPDHNSRLGIALSFAFYAVIGVLFLGLALGAGFFGIWFAAPWLQTIAIVAAVASFAAFMRHCVCEPYEWLRVLILFGFVGLSISLLTYVSPWPYASHYRASMAATAMCAFYGFQRIRRPRHVQDPMAGATALHLAGHAGAEHVFRLLLTRGADPTAATDTHQSVFFAISRFDLPGSRGKLRAAQARLRMKGLLLAALSRQGPKGVATILSSLKPLAARVCELFVEGCLVAAALWWKPENHF